MKDIFGESFPFFFHDQEERGSTRGEQASYQNNSKSKYSKEATPLNIQLRKIKEPDKQFLSYGKSFNLVWKFLILALASFNTLLLV